MGYGLVMISHSQDKTFKDENGVEFNQIVPTLGNKPRLIVDRMSDIIGYAHPVEQEDGICTYLEMRGTNRYVAGSRFKYTPQRIAFTYDNLVNAIGDAIDMQAKENNGTLVTDERTNAYDVKPEKDFTKLMSQFDDMVKKIQDNTTKTKFKTDWAPKITEIINTYLGIGKKVADCTPAQIEQLELIVSDLSDAIGAYDFS